MGLVAYPRETRANVGQNQLSQVRPRIRDRSGQSAFETLLQGARGALQVDRSNTAIDSARRRPDAESDGERTGGAEAPATARRPAALVVLAVQERLDRGRRDPLDVDRHGGPLARLAAQEAVGDPRDRGADGRRGGERTRRRGTLPAQPLPGDLLDEATHLGS